ncbi:MAG: DUF2290 domain-containing protein [Ruminococcus sp.]|nr:DUF2290 domain-containing protein [Ruminococcus sp.]MCC8174075.1 DUF2290 domain-containing protein [Odoribacter sp.]
MSDSKFIVSIKETIEFLQKEDFLGEVLYVDHEIKTSGFTENYTVSDFSDHKEYYDTLQRNRDYTIRLADDSLIQYRKNNDLKYSYIYVQNPTKHPDFREFISAEFPEDRDYNLDELFGLYQEEYLNYLDTQKRNEKAIYMRLDVDPNTYYSSGHAYVHLHINLLSEIRIPFSLVISPLAFCTFVYKHVYSKKWNNFIMKSENNAYIPKIKDVLFDIPKDFWQDKDKIDLFIK